MEMETEIQMGPNGVSRDVVTKARRIHNSMKLLLEDGSYTEEAKIIDYRRKMK
ncbi:unnamed protein product [Rhodiola kirilowii]